MGHTYRNVIWADGGSGGPQMRYGGLCENSLIIEGYWYSSAATDAPWVLEREAGESSAVVRDNVQLVYAYPSPNDPDTEEKSDGRAQPGWGYTLQGVSFGAVVEGNIISGALLQDDLGFETRGRGLAVGAGYSETESGSVFNQRDNVIRDNIVYRMKNGLRIGGDWTAAENVVVENNAFHCEQPINMSADTLPQAQQLLVRDNRFYTEEGLPEGSWIGSDNTVAELSVAASEEQWPDPDRTLRRYVFEELGLTLLEWQDDPYLPEEAIRLRRDAGEAYDPTGG